MIFVVEQGAAELQQLQDNVISNEITELPVASKSVSHRPLMLVKSANQTLASARSPFMDKILPTPSVEQLSTCELTRRHRT